MQVLITGAYADALVLDQQASGRRAQEMLGWRPHRRGVLEDLERGPTHRRRGESSPVIYSTAPLLGGAVSSRCYGTP